MLCHALGVTVVTPFPETWLDRSPEGFQSGRGRSSIRKQYAVHWVFIQQTFGDGLTFHCMHSASQNDILADFTAHS